MSTEKSKNVVITKKARENLVKARAGAITLPKIIGMAFGEGGVNGSGVVIAPTESQSRLNKELFRKAIDGYTFPNDTTCRYECTLDVYKRQNQAGVPGRSIRNRRRFPGRGSSTRVRGNVESG